MTKHEWYKRAFWKVEVPQSNPGFTYASEEMELNRISFSIDVTVKEESVKKNFYESETVVWMPQINVKYHHKYELEEEEDGTVKMDWSVNCIHLHDPDEVYSFQDSTNLTAREPSTWKLVATHTSSCFWMKEVETYLLTVTLKLKSPLGKRFVAERELSFSEAWKHSDVTFIVEGEEIHAHRQVLALNSPVFDSMLYNDFKEKHSQAIELPGKDRENFTDFLRLLYCQYVIPLLDIDTGLRLIGLFHEYQVTTLEDLLEGLLLRKVDKNSALECLAAAQKYDYKNLTQEALAVLSEFSTEQLHEMKSFHDASEDVKTLIRDSRIMYLET